MYFIKSKYEPVELKKGDNFAIYTIENISYITFCDCDHIYIRLVIIPNQTKITYMYKDCLASNRIIQSDRYYIFNRKTIIKFHFDIKKGYVNMASFHGCINILQFMKDIGLLNLKNYYSYNHILMDEASKEGRINVLEWWKNSELHLEYTKESLRCASSIGNIDVLNWWKNSGLSLEYNHEAIDYASQHGNIHVLSWWKDSGLKLKYSVWSLTYPLYACKIDVLEWWKNSGLPFDNTHNVINTCLHILRNTPDTTNVLQWLSNNSSLLNININKIDPR